MKFLKFFLAAAILIISVFSKKIRKQDSQSTRNYRKVHANPSLNPLPASWSHGPLASFSQHTPQKYKAYNSQLAGTSTYTDVTAQMRRAANGQI